MVGDINLLIQKRKGFFSEEHLLLISKVAAVISVVLVVSTSILFFLLSRDPSVVAIKADESKTIAQLTLLQNKTAKYLVIVDRVNKIKAIEKSQSQFGASISSLVQQVPPGSTITNFILDKNSLSLSVSSDDLSLLGKTVDNFTRMVEQKKILKAITIDSLISDEKGGKYVLSITGNLL